MKPEQMEANTRREDEARDRAALESAWDKINRKIDDAGVGYPGGLIDGLREVQIRFTLRELTMLRQFRRKFA